MAGGSGLATALRIAEEMRDEIRSNVGVTGLRLQLAREPVPLTIGLDDSRSVTDAVLLLTVSDAEGDLGTVLLSDQARRAYSPADAAAVHAIVDRYRPALRDWLSRPDAS